jgi:hypothetical protein
MFTLYMQLMVQFQSKFETGSTLACRDRSIIIHYTLLRSDHSTEFDTAAMYIQNLVTDIHYEETRVECHQIDCISEIIQNPADTGALV